MLREQHSPEHPRRSVALKAVIEEYADEPDECTIYPDPAPREQETTAWISAKTGSFVPLDDVR